MYVCIHLCLITEMLGGKVLQIKIIKSYLYKQIINIFLYSDFPCNYLPCLQMDDGNMMPETMAICRYLAREHGKSHITMQ